MTTRTIASIEDIEIGKKYTITIAPDDSHQYFEVPKRDGRLLKFISWARIYIYKAFLNNEYELFTEVSPRGRLHFHGTIKFKSNEHLLDFYIYTIPHLLKSNQIEIDTIKDPKVWDEYKRKQQKFNLPVITSNDKINKLCLFDTVTEVTYTKIPLED